MEDPLAGLDDASLIQRIRQGEVQAWQQLALKYRKKVFGWAFSSLGNNEDAEDVAHETFVRAIVKLEQFRGESSFATWLFAICRNLCLTKKRELARRGKWIAGSIDETIETEEGEEPKFQIADPSLSPGEIAVQNEEDELLRKALNMLPKEEREIIELKDNQGLKYEEIAEGLKLKEPTVRSKHLRALRKLQIILRKMGVERGVERK